MPKYLRKYKVTTKLREQELFVFCEGMTYLFIGIK